MQMLITRSRYAALKTFLKVEMNAYETDKESRVRCVLIYPESHTACRAHLDVTILFENAERVCSGRFN